MPTQDRVHDRAVLDALEGVEETPFGADVFRIARKGRDPVRGSSANGRWSSNGEFEVLYTSLERAGSLAEIGSRLLLEPVWPSRLRHEIHRIGAEAERCLKFADIASLQPLGVDPARFEGYDYQATQAIAAAAHFLEFDGLIVPSARHASLNLVVFMDRIDAGTLEVKSSEDVDWDAWRNNAAHNVGVRR